MNVVLLFLTRADLASMPHIPQWMTDHKVRSYFALANPHLVLDEVSEEQEILAEVRSATPDSSKRLGLEIKMQQRWMQFPRDEFERRGKELFRSLPVGASLLSESFMPDRIPELLMKLRPDWPKAIPLGEYTLVFGNQIQPMASARPYPKAPAVAGKIGEKIKRQRTPAQLANDAKLRARRVHSRDTVIV